MAKRGRDRYLDGTVHTSRVSQGRSLIKSIQRGTVTIPNASVTATATIIAVDMSNSVLHYLGQAEQNTGGSGASQAIIALTNATTITAERLWSTYDLIISFEVVEYWPGFIKSIQRGQVAALGGTPGNATISAVNMAKSQVIFLGTKVNDNASGSGFNWFMTLTLTSSTNVQGLLPGGGQNYTNFQVVEYY